MGKHAVLRATSPVVANAIAALLIHLEKTRGSCRMVTSNGRRAIRSAICSGFLILGEGDVAPVTHEVLRRAVRDPKHRPVVHVS